VWFRFRGCSVGAPRNRRNFRVDRIAESVYRLSTMSGCPPTDLAPDLRPVEGDAADEELANLAKALGHPARVQILRLLIARNNCICGEIVDELPLAQSTVSQHLKILKEAGLVRGEVDGPRICYCIEPRGLKRLRTLVASL
jgi:DNA-binding transcriptional ArsR family regulator